MGFTFSNKDGNLHSHDIDKYCISQFKFQEFNRTKDKYAIDSIELLQHSGIDFKKKKEKGIDAQVFGELLISSGLVLNDDVESITFHGWYGFVYVVELLTC